MYRLRGSSLTNHGFKIFMPKYKKNSKHEHQNILIKIFVQNKIFSYLPTQPLLAWVAGGATNNILSLA